ncbi:MAG TPA: hypothetical protein VL993_09585, partial [Stellaceae bacterium]|nr:hypothetical protein [Stellaceae bacterium]
ARIFCVLAALWMVVMAWRLYPQFGNAIRVDGQQTTVAAYLRDACGRRVGPAAVTCLAEAREETQLMLRREQGKSVLLILAPAIFYALWWPAYRLHVELRARRAAASSSL